MNQTFLAIYENGMFRPLEPLQLHEGQIVRIRIETISEEKSQKNDEQKVVGD